MQARTCKKTLSLFLVLAMLCSLLVVSASATGSTETITTAAQLKDMTNGDYVLGNDIEIDATTWTPISNFSGTFDGAGHTITWTGTSASSMEAVDSYFAIFGTNSGTIENLTVAGALYVSGSNLDYVSTVVGYNEGTISNVNNEATLYADGSIYNVGGIAGFNDEGTISNCANTADVTGYSQVGGIVGENAGTVEICSNIGDIYGTNAGKSGIGGIAGRNGDNNTATETGVIRNCYNQGNITSGTPGVSSTQGQWVGGICGFQNSLSSCVNCYNTGNLVGYGYLDHTAGRNEGTVTNCYGLDDDEHDTGAENYDGTILATDEAMKGNAQVTVEDEQGEEVAIGYIEDLLNNGGSVWTQTAGSYPEFSTGSSPVEPTGDFEIEMLSQPNKTAYTVGESFSTAGMIIGAVYENGYVDYITDYTVSPSGALTTDDASVTISGSYEGESYSFTITITVNAVAPSSVTLGGDGTYSTLEDALEAVASGGTIYVCGTVEISSDLTSYDSVTIQRDSSFTGSPLFKVTDGTVTLASSSMIIDGEGSGTLFEVTGGNLRLRGGVTLTDCDVAVDVQNGGTVTVNKTSIDADEYSFQVANGGTLIMCDFGGTSIDGTIYLASGAYITVWDAILCDLTVESVVITPGTVIAAGDGSATNPDGYFLTDTDAGKIELTSGDFLDLDDINNQLVVAE